MKHVFFNLRNLRWLCAALFVVSGQAALAATIHVATDGVDSDGCGASDSPCQTIQYGVNMAASGDTVLVGAGTYTENVVVETNSLRLLSVSGYQHTVITAADTNGDTLTVMADDVRVGRVGQGFTLTGSLGRSGMLLIGDTCRVEGNRATGNGAFGLQFGFLDIPLTPEGCTVPVGCLPDTEPGEPELGAPTPVPAGEAPAVVGCRVNHNIADHNLESGFYFRNFDDGRVNYNQGYNNEINRGGFMGFGAGFYIDRESERLTAEHNEAWGNELDGFFYRTNDVNNMVARHNRAWDNGQTGMRFMGTNVTAINNYAEGNGLAGLRFMGYDGVIIMRDNTSINNQGPGIHFDMFEFNRQPLQIRPMRRNNLSGNDPESNCGILNESSNTLRLNDNYWGTSDGPGDDPADTVCGAHTVNQPSKFWNFNDSYEHLPLAAPLPPLGG